MRSAMILLTAMVFGTAAQAADTAPMRAGISPACRAEMVQLCPKTGDREARHACMMEKRASISAPCKAELMAKMQARRAAREAAPMTPAPAPTPRP